VLQGRARWLARPRADWASQREARFQVRRYGKHVARKHIQPLARIVGVRSGGRRQQMAGAVGEQQRRTAGG
jgi:hypothetical protein